MIFRTLIVGILVSQFAKASGVITGGGGGTTNPTPVTEYSVSSAVDEYAGTVLISWFRRQQSDYAGLSSTEKLASPFRKIFESNQSILKTIRDTSIEVRSSGPCLDAEGQAWDGSIYANSPHAICLSSKTMAPKLTYANVEPESIALAAHEYAHLFGANEDEAVTIQKLALEIFNDVQFLDLKSQVVDLALKLEPYDYVGPKLVPNALHYFREFINNRIPSLDYGDLIALDDKVDSIVHHLTPKSGTFFYAPVELIQLSAPNYAKLKINSYYLCSIDMGIRESRRNTCQQSLNNLFGTNKEVLFSDYLDRVYSKDTCLKYPTLCYGVNYKNLKIKKPMSADDVRQSYAEVDLYLQSIKTYIDDLSTCGGKHFGKNNCNAYKRPNQPLPFYEIYGNYNNSSHKVRCTGVRDWPHLYDTTCIFEDGPGVKPDHDGTIQFEVRNGIEAVPWYCSGKDLQKLLCVQPL